LIRTTEVPAFSLPIPKGRYFSLETAFRSADFIPKTNSAEKSKKMTFSGKLKYRKRLEIFLPAGFRSV
jgi:hypothetical protein